MNPALPADVLALALPAALEPDFMRRAIAAAVLVGLAAPLIGTFLVQRRLALLGDGIGHVALTGVALGFLLGTAPVLTAVVVAALGATALELLRSRGGASGDVALALLFYGGIAGGVALMGFAGGSSTQLLGYLFGSVSTVSGSDLALIAVLAALVVAVVAVVGRELFVVCFDEEVAEASGLPVRALSVLLAVTAALVVALAMRVVGVLLVSALMVVPVAAAQQVARSFRGTLTLAVVGGIVAAVTGLLVAYYADTAPGAAIVLVALAGFLVALGGSRAWAAVAR